MKYIYMYILFLLFVKCKNNETCIGGVNMFTDIDLQLTDSLNNDLLDQLKPNSYKFTDMNHYILASNNSKQLVNTGGDYPKAILVFKDLLNKSTLRVFPSGVSFTQIGVFYSTDIIELSSYDEDTIKSEIEITKIPCGQNIITKRIWYNNELVYTYGIQSERKFTIQK